LSIVATPLQFLCLLRHRPPLKGKVSERIAGHFLGREDRLALTFERPFSAFLGLPVHDDVTISTPIWLQSGLS
jgi:hypothetical protein